MTDWPNAPTDSTGTKINKLDVIIMSQRLQKFRILESTEKPALTKEYVEFMAGYTKIMRSNPEAHIAVASRAVARTGELFELEMIKLVIQKYVQEHFSVDASEGNNLDVMAHIVFRVMEAMIKDKPAVGKKKKQPNTFKLEGKKLK